MLLPKPPPRVRHELILGAYSTLGTNLCSKTNFSKTAWIFACQNLSTKFKKQVNSEIFSLRAFQMMQKSKNCELSILACSLHKKIFKLVQNLNLCKYTIKTWVITFTQYLIWYFLLILIYKDQQSSLIPFWNLWCKEDWIFY